MLYVMLCIPHFTALTSHLLSSTGLFQLNVEKNNKVVGLRAAKNKQRPAMFVDVTQR